MPVLPWLVWLSSPQAGAPVAPVAERFAGTELVLRSYLTLAAVDARGRRPFRPDAVLARHLIEPGSAPPRAGESVRGESGEARWAARTAGEDGRLGDVAWAHARVESDAARVVLARLEGATTLFVNGAPFVGDVYGYGFGGVPVALVEGSNELYVSGLRGAFRLSLAPCEPGVQFGAWDLTLPSQTVGEPSDCLSGVLLLNAATEPADVVLEVVERPDGPALFSTRCSLVPLGLRKVRIAPRYDRRPDAPGRLALTLRLTEGNRVPRALALTFPVRAATEVGVRTFTSRIDGSVQEYAVRPPPGVARDRSCGILLSLHGAGVDCEGQAACYAPKEDLWIVAPTNRRPFGFDWQDWGRIDAYEALAAARLLPGAGRAPVFLSGHSMGGHGTWHLAANDPDAFRAIAPSAGWRSFDSYGGRPEGALRALWHAADAASRTEDLLANLVQLPTFVLHGEADDNVPAAEGHAMVDALRAAGGEPHSHFQPGAGHWWDDDSGAAGTACLDWPGFFALFRATAASEPRALDWHGLDLGLDGQHHWVEVEQLLAYGRPFHVRAGAPSAGRVSLASRNVRRLVLRPPPAWEVRAVELDGQVLPLADPGTFQLGDLGWEAVASTDRLFFAEKRPWCNGPLKRAFDREFVLVVPTLGSEAENAAALARARHDAETWWYRGNGDVAIVPDRRLQNAGLEWNNLVLYGNADTNAAWGSVVPPEYPLEIRRGKARLGAEQWEGAALGALAVGSSGEALFAVLGSSGPAADRGAASLALFVSGVGYPDYVVYGPEVLAQGDGGVRAAGFFDHRWRLPEGEVALGR